MKKSEKKWWILLSMCLLTVMLNIDATAINIAIPVMAREFQASLASMQWVINAYVLLAAMFQILGGKMGDTYGHKKIFLWGTALFVFSSAGAGISTSEQMLITFRVLQGLALGVAYPMTIAITFATFSKKQQALAMSFIIATMGISLSMGPPIGGLFVNYIGWRWIFFVNVPIGLIAIYLAAAFCPKEKDLSRKKIDYRGAALLVLGLFGVVLAWNQVQNWGFSSWLFWFSFVVGLGFLTTLYFSEKKEKHPIINFKLFKIRNFLFNNIIRLIAQLVFIPVLFFVPIYLQNIAGYHALYSGMVMLFLTVIIGVLSPIAGKWIDSVGDRVPNVVSMLLFTIGCAFMSHLERVPEMYVLGIGLLFIGIATGINFVSTTTGSVSVVPQDKQGEASGIIFTTAWFGCALGVALMGLIVAMVGNDFLWFQVADMNLTSEQMGIIDRVSKGMASFRVIPQYFSADAVRRVTMIATESFMVGFRMSMLILMSCSFVGLVLAVFLKKEKAVKTVTV